MKYSPFFLLFAVFIGCATAKLSGTGINVQDSAHYINVQANSFNAELGIDEAGINAYK